MAVVNIGAPYDTTQPLFGPPTAPPKPPPMPLVAYADRGRLISDYIKPAFTSVASTAPKSPAPVAAPSPMPTYAQAPVESGPPWTLIAAGVGALAIGAVVVIKLRKR